MNPPSSSWSSSSSSSSSSYTYFSSPANPSPYPNSNFLYSQSQNTPPPPPPPPPPSPSADLSTTLSSLRNLIHLSHRTLSSLFTLLPSKPQSPNLIPCPFNPHHLMPPHSLFLHSLRCHFPPLLYSLHLSYPETLKHLNRTSVPQPSFDSHSDSISHPQLCFSLDDIGANFFYENCPGVVCLSNPGSSKHTFTIPSFLSSECADLVPSCGGEIEGLGKECSFKILPSELWAIRKETEAWSDYPRAYTYGVACSLSRGTRMLGELDLMDWVIANSPRYGVVIDVALRDHIFSLFRLCLKAIVKEALSFDQDQMSKNNSTNSKCPVLVQALFWFASQLSILYGERNASLFSINMLKQCIVEAAALGLLIFPLEQKVAESPTLAEEASPSKNLVAGDIDIRDAKPLDRIVTGKAVFVSQVRAAIAALHERALVEEKIKALRVSQPLTTADHDYVSMRADEERKIRPKYRPIIDHDGLPRQGFSTEEPNKTKSREELLAEERDYKRRRMSYRGKKGKRTSLQVTRDIIEEYMAEIEKAGGIGCFAKGTKEGQILPSELPSHNTTISIDEPIKTGWTATASSQHNNWTQSHSDYGRRSKSFKDASKDYEWQRRSLHEHHDNVDKVSVGEDKRDRGTYSRSPESYKSHGSLRTQSGHRRKRDDLEVTRTWHDEFKLPYSGISKYNDRRSSSSASSSLKGLSTRKVEQKTKFEHKQRRNTFEIDSSDSLVQNAFEDRYNPSESPNMDEDDLSTW